jgi:hypothetical protein
MPDAPTIVAARMAPRETGRGRHAAKTHCGDSILRAKFGYTRAMHPSAELTG